MMMKKILIIARREFLITVVQRGYIFTLVAIPLFLALMGQLFNYIASMTKQSRESGTIGVVDQAGVFDFQVAERLLAVAARQSASAPDAEGLTLARYESVEAALNDVRTGALPVLYIIKPDFLRTGETELYSRESWRGRSARGLAAFQQIVRASLLQQLALSGVGQDPITSQALNRLSSIATLKKFAVTYEGAVFSADNAWVKLSRILAPLGVMFLLGLALGVSAGYLLQSTAEEKENRVIEIVFSSVKPDELLWGKILGLGGAAMAQVLVYLGLIKWTASSYLVFLSIPGEMLALFLIYCLLDYLLAAGLLIAIGILAGNLHSSSQLSTPLVMVTVSPVFFMVNLMAEPNGTIARVLSYIPLTSPLTMMFRLTMAKVPVVDVVVSLVLLAASAYLSVRGAAKVFRAASLMYGKRIRLSEVVRWLRAA
jgi:ABC-2 type transport system permease protein